MKKIPLILSSALLALTLTGCGSEEDTTPEDTGPQTYLDYIQGSVSYLVQSDESIIITWRKAYKGHAQLEVAALHPNGDGWLKEEYDNVSTDLVLFDEYTPIIARGLSDEAQTVDIKCTPTLRTAEYTTYFCKTVGSNFQGHLLLPTNTNSNQVFESYLGLFKNLCQSGKITITQGNTDEDRNRCRAICS